MKKWILSLLLVLALCLTGCHGSPERASFQIPEEFDTSRNYEIAFWAKNDTNVVQADIYRQAILDFQELYPNITVNMRLYTDYSRIYNDVITNIATSTTPNVCITYPDHIATYLTGNNTVVPLDDLLTDARFGLGGSQVKFDAPTKAEIVPEFLQECSFAGHYYCLPYMRSTEACYVNKTYVEKLGFTLPEKLTWDYIWQVSEAAMEKNTDGTYKVNGQKVLIPFIYKSTDNMMIQMLHQLDAPYSDAAGNIGIFSDTTADLLETIGSHTQSGAFSTFKISGYPANFLNAGQCIFAIDSTAGATWMGSSAPMLDISADALVEFETAVMTIPQFDTAHPSMISQGPSVCVFNKEDPQQVLASWLFTQYLLSDEVQIAYSCTEGYVPVTTKAQANSGYQDYLSWAGEDNDTHYSVKIQAAKLLMENTENTFVTPVFNGSASLRSAAGELIETVVKSTRRKQAIDMDKVYSDTSALYRLDQISTNAGERMTFGPLPGEAKMLLGALALCWLGIGTYVLADGKKRKK